MPGMPPPVADEREGLLAFLQQQRDAVRISAAAAEGWPESPWLKPWRPSTVTDLADESVVPIQS